jgi:ATP-binding cassette, subfamily B, bacterial PglK
MTMSRYNIFFREILYILGKEKKKIPWFVLVFLIISALDVAGIGLITVYLSSLVNKDLFLESNIYEILTSINFLFISDNLLESVGLLLIVIFAIKTIVAIVLNKMVESFSFQEGVRLQLSLMNSYQSMPFAEYSDNNSSKYIHTITSLVGSYTGILLSLLRFTSEAILAVSIVLLLAMANFLVLLFAVLIFALMMAVYDKLFRSELNSFGVLSNKFSNKIIQAVVEGIKGLKEIRILGKEDYFYDRLKSNSIQHADINIRASVITIAPRFVFEFIFVLMIVLPVVIYQERGGDAENLISIMTLFGVAFIRLMPFINRVTQTITKLRRGRHAIKLLYNDLIKIKKNDINMKWYEDVDAEFNNISFNNIDFKYPNTSNNILNNISLKIKSKDVIGLIGVSGSGKTTLVNLMLGLLSPTKGSMLLNGQNILDNIHAWQRKVAYIPQEVFLLDGSIKQNIALGEKPEEVDNCKLERSIKMAQLERFMNKMPEGVETKIGENGSHLSGGQKQRIALARAFYYDREILIMDESTSALDDETENEILKEIKELTGKKTLVIISHTKKVLQYCNAIYKVKDGELINIGDYQEMEKNA